MIENMNLTFISFAELKENKLLKDGVVRDTQLAQFVKQHQKRFNSWHPHDL
jgi:hypothetical protein